VSLLGGFGQCACTRGWAVLDDLHSKELKQIYAFVINNIWTHAANEMLINYCAVESKTDYMSVIKNRNIFVF